MPPDHTDLEGLPYQALLVLRGKNGGLRKSVGLVEGREVCSFV